MCLIFGLIGLGWMKMLVLGPGAVLVASMEKHLAGEIIRLDHAAQMWAFLHQHYELSSQSTYIAALRQEQLLQQGDSSVEDFFRQLSTVWPRF
jgi:hypothetical protein